MKSPKIAVLLYLILPLLLMASSAAMGWGAQDRRPPREKWEFVSFHATIESIDLEKREVVLKNGEGALETVVVGEGVKRLDEFKAGDSVKADYWVYAAVEFREPTASEKAEPLVVLAEGGVAPADFPPGATVGAIVRAVVTVEHIARLAGEVTVKGPQGKYMTIPVPDKRLRKDLRKGEVAVITYAEAVALSLEKVM